MNIPLIAGTAVIIGVIIEAVVLLLIVRMLNEANAVRKNYLGLDINVSTGISFHFTLIIS